MKRVDSRARTRVDRSIGKCLSWSRHQSDKRVGHLFDVVQVFDRRDPTPEGKQMSGKDCLFQCRRCRAGRILPWSLPRKFKRKSHG